MSIDNPTGVSPCTKTGIKRHEAREEGFSVLLHASSADSDMRYFGRSSAMDPFLAFGVNGRKVAVVPIHEYDIMLKQSEFDEILLLPDVQEQAARNLNRDDPSSLEEVELLKHLVERYEIPGFRVSSRFPSGMLVALQQAGIPVQVETGDELFPQRIHKSASEVEAIRKANRASAAGFEVVAQTLAESTVNDGIVHHQGTALTAERLRDLIRQACLAEGAVAMQTIVAAGDQACENHCEGYGPIPANELIVVDIFPQRIDDGYWGDMTRTFLKGRANEDQRRLVQTVMQAHRLSADGIKPGKCSGELHREILTYFDSQGYETQRSGEERSGFFHALGHGLGLEVHEAPVMRATSTTQLKEGMVVTIEPGLYYKGLGGCRIEDVMHVTADGSQMISSAPYEWEIP